MAEIEKLDLKSQDIAADKQEKLKELFPEIFTEGDKIDFEKLRLTLGDSVDTNDERFGLHWAGKKECFSIIQEPSIGTLKPAKDESVNWDDTENLFIEGDNLEVLKLLQKSYYGKVKMIYIDPPYNTGKEFIYPDKYQENLDTYLAYTGQVDDDGYKFSTNAETEGRFHSNWLNMMYPRLFLARNLLKDDGVIFISIDEHEIDNLKGICKDVFGEENILGVIANINNPKGRSDDNFLATAHEYIIVAVKNKEEAVLHGFEPDYKITRRYNKVDNSKGKYREIDLRKTGDADLRKDRPDMFYFFYYREEDKDLIVSKEQLDKPEYREIIPLRDDDKEGRWRWGFNTANKNLDKLICRFMPNRKIWGVFEKDYLEGRPPVKSTTAWNFKDVNSERGSEEFIELGFDKEVFPRPKPVGTLKRTINVGTKPNKQNIILDFFAGSASFSQASLEINAERKRNNQFILVQLPETLNPNKKEDKAAINFCIENNLPTNISEIGKERIRRVIRKIKAEKESLEAKLQAKETALAELQAQKAKTPELFENGRSKELTDLESAIEELKTKIANIENTDLGFKVFKLDKSNFKIWDGSVENDVPKQIEMAINHINPDSDELDILYEILLKAGFELTLPIQELTLADKKVYSVEDDALLICLESELTEDVIRAIAAKEPARVVCLDAGFKNNDQLKTNAVQIMKSHNVHDFKTV